jgi:DNA modification methylase
MSDRFEILTGDCTELMKTLPPSSIDAIVTDPPYGLAFMGKRWDYDVPRVEVWEQCLRVLKPGGHLLAFSGTRTQHRMAVRIEDGGFEIRDMIAWVYGSGFPKSLDVSKAIDRAAGIEREDKFEGAFERRSGPTGNKKCDDCGKWLISGSPCKCPRPQDKAITDAGRQWSGWGTALKPAMEPITVARKPIERTVARNVLKWGTAALNVDGCRVRATDNDYQKNCSGDRGHAGTRSADFTGVTDIKSGGGSANDLGRWPANFIHDGSDEVVGLFPQSGGQNGATGPKYGDRTTVNTYGDYGPRPEFEPRKDKGSAARFFYCAKASKSDRNDGLVGLPPGVVARSNQAKKRAESGEVIEAGSGAFNKARYAKNNHPTVKPTELMRYLCRLITPPGGLILDPFAGSGSTGKAAMLEGFQFIGIEREPDYAEVARMRIEKAAKGSSQQPFLF